MRYRVLSLLCLAAVIAYVQRSALSVPATTIRDELGLDAKALGAVMSGWYWGYAIMQIPCGWVADRLGSRRALTIFALLWSLFTASVGLAASYSELLLLWSLMGLAQAGIFPCAAKAIAAWFPDTQRGLASGLLASSMAVGTALAPALAGRLLTFLSWQQTLFVYAVPGLAWAVLFYLLTADRQRQPLTSSRPRSAVLDWQRLLTSRSIWLLCTQQFLRAAAMVFFSTWFPTFLQKTRGASQLESGNLASWTGVGAMLGAMVGGLVSDWILRRTGSHKLSRQGIAVAGMTCCSLLTLASHFVDDVHTAVLLMSFGTFSATFGGVSGYAVAMHLGGRQVGTVFSTMNMCGNIGGALFPLAVAWLVERHDNWDLALYLFAGIFAAAAVCWAFLDPREAVFEEAR